MRTTLIVTLIRLTIAASASSSSLPNNPQIISSTLAQYSQRVGGPFSADAIANFLRSRCGSNNPKESPAVWTYEGTLTDPVTGRVIADVEGLEIVKQLPMIQHSHLSNNDDERSIMNNLSVNSLLCSSDKDCSTPQWDAAITVLSRRLFCYRRRSSKLDNSNHHSDSASDDEGFSPYDTLLTSLRHRPDGPLRHLSPEESMSTYDTAVTYISRNNGKEMVVMSERGGIIAESNDHEREYFIGHAAQGTSSSNFNSLFPTFDFAILAQRGSELVLPPLKRSDQLSGSEDIEISPQRSRLIQFGKGDGSASGSTMSRKYGSVRETYSYSFNNAIEANSQNINLLGWIKNKMGGRRLKKESFSVPEPNECTVRYIRYGEAPPWYAPGRSCTLDLQGKRIIHPASITDSSADGSTVGDATNNLPSLTSWAASKCNFWSGWPTVFSSEGTDLVKQYYQLPSESESELTCKAVQLFLNEPRRMLDRMMDDDNEYPMPDQIKWLLDIENSLSRIQSCMKRISKSFILSELPTP